jgi:peroxiredoxin
MSKEKDRSRVIFSLQTSFCCPSRGTRRTATGTARGAGTAVSVLSDPDFAVSGRYGVYRSDEVDKGPQPHGEPAVFLLDVQGDIAYTQILSSPKGLANPAEMALVLLYMCHHIGRYW